MSLDLEFPNEPTAHAWARRKATDDLPRHWACIQCGDKVFRDERPEPGLCTRRLALTVRQGPDSRQSIQIDDIRISYETSEVKLTQQQIDDARCWFRSDRSGGCIEWPSYLTEMTLFDAAERLHAYVDGVVPGNVLALNTRTRNLAERRLEEMDWDEARRRLGGEKWDKATWRIVGRPPRIKP